MERLAAWPDCDHAVGIGQNGDVLIANDWMVGAIIPSLPLEDWDREQTFEGASALALQDLQRPAQQPGGAGRLARHRPDDRWPLLGGQQGLRPVAMTDRAVRTTAVYTKATRCPPTRISALAATDDGALYIGTDGRGPVAPGGGPHVSRPCPSVAGRRVLQLVYDPTVTPAMLYVLTDAGLTVLRGP